MADDDKFAEQANRNHTYRSALLRSQIGRWR